MCAFIGTLNTYVLLCTYKTTMVMKPSNFDANRLQVSHFFYAKLAYQLEFSSNYSQLEMGSSWNFPARASPSCEYSEPSRAGHFNFRAENELTILTICMSKNS